jgi:Undecaprenyl-phosphate glucose phosphotransferase
MPNTFGLRTPTAGDSSTILGAQSSSRRTRALLPFHWIEGVTICCDVVLLVSTSVLSGIAYHLVFWDQIGPINTFLGIGTLVGVNMPLVLAAREDYRPQNLANFRRQVRETTLSWLCVFSIVSAAGFSLKVSEIYSRGATLSFFVAGCSVIIIWRYVIARVIGRALAIGAFAEQKVILLADEAQLTEAGALEQLRLCGYRPVRTFGYERNSVSPTSTEVWLQGLLEEIVQVIRQEQIECVFLLVPWDDRRSIAQLMELLRVLSVPIYLLPDQNVSHLLAGRIVHIGTSWIAELKRAPLTTTEQACKRALDVVISLATLIMLAPLMLTVAALIKIESRGPILFKQTRNGFNGRPFRIYKFRTMSVLEDGAVIRQATKNDPRTTRLGRMLRRLNIDELPQLFNVIAGNMTLVGPRPHAAAHNAEYEKILANYAYRYHVKPGVTGWAQVNGFRGETQTVDLMAKRVDLDLWYINNWSLWLDFKILLRTLVVGMQPTAY